jgi:hypothetical protein
MDITNVLDSMCKPLLIFLIFEMALITYNLTQYQFKKASTNLLMTIIGGLMIYLLCVSGFETAAWLLLSIVPFFFVAIIALLIITQLMNINISNTNKPKSVLHKIIKHYGYSEQSYDDDDDCEYTENPTIDNILDNQCDNC